MCQPQGNTAQNSSLIVSLWVSLLNIIYCNIWVRIDNQ